MFQKECVNILLYVFFPYEHDELSILKVFRNLFITRKNWAVYKYIYFLSRLLYSLIFRPCRSADIFKVLCHLLRPRFRAQTQFGH